MATNAAAWMIGQDQAAWLKVRANSANKKILLEHDEDYCMMQSGMTVFGSFRNCLSFAACTDDS